ncbi:MAG: glycerol-3-phosphate dehydrogenase/oxidase [Hyphomicrobiales bacterium]
MSAGVNKAVQEVDVVVIGAGINGAGLFRDLCEQGISCLIVDKADYGSGTSAAPSRLIHGGLKYLETGEFGLVAQSTLERNLLLRNAPHCVSPLPTMIPIFSWTKGIGAAVRTLFGSTTAPRSRGAMLMKIGLWLYDFYGSRARTMPKHSLVGRGKALASMPAMTKEIVAAGTYYDAWISHPERLVWELISDGLKANAASSAMNATSITNVQDGVLTFQPEFGGAVSVRPKLVVNAAGPWIDDVNATLGAPSKMIGGTKGSHILLKHEELIAQLQGRMIYFEADDGRICLVFDHQGLALVGSTDIPADNPDSVHCEDDEIDYMLDSLRKLLPGLSFDRSQIAYVYSGIRPLPASDASTPGLISRDHSAPIAEPDGDQPFPILSLIGGKWTTFRGFAEEVTDTILERTSRSRMRSTQELPIGGGHDYPSDQPARDRWIVGLAGATGLDKARLGILLTRYGTTATEIARHESGWPDQGRLPDSDSYSLAEIDWIARNEMVVHLGDIVMRRTTLAIEGKLTQADMEKVADVTAAALGWDAARQADEVAKLAARLTEINLMRL